ncbi:MAG: hypothetical protein V2A73_14845 [Pseudomonadota bacterium]
MSFIGGPKLGGITSPGGGAGENAAQTITATKQTIGPLSEGEYSIVGDQDLYAVQGIAAAVAALDAAAIAAQGVEIPAVTEVPFTVGSNDGYVAWVRKSADGTNLRINRRSWGFGS